MIDEIASCRNTSLKPWYSMVSICTWLSPVCTMHAMQLNRIALLATLPPVQPATASCQIKPKIQEGKGEGGVAVTSVPV